ncbi:MAG: hypothetical protein GY705_17680 [Bacteroidetes bacterium]|nr:hypothetical protein [Bacteroidota bacterium]
MVADFKNRILYYITKNQFSLFLISIIFFFAWSDLLIDSGHRITDWIIYSGWVLIIGGLIIPIILLIGAIQYKSAIAFGATMTIFTLTILTNLSALPYYIQEYQLEIPLCSCCPICEIKTIMKIVLACCFAIYLMNRESFRNTFQWRKDQSLKLISLISILYLIVESF